MDRVRKMEEFVEGFVPEMMREGKIPGFSIAVIASGEVVYAMGFGSRDPARSLPATPDTLYGIGSCTKSFVSAAIMQLAEDGALKLTDPASKYIPLKIGLSGKPVTIHSLLTHSSGIPSLATSRVALQRGIGLDMGVPWGGVDDFYRLVNGAQGEIAGEPGHLFFYNNAAFRMLGHVIQEVSGVPFHRYMTENIFEPLGLERTTLVKGEYLSDPDRMTPHWKKPDGSIVPTEFPYPDVTDNPGFSFIAAAGGIVSSVKELTTYLQMNMGGGLLGGTRILSPESVELMHTLHTDSPPNLHGRFGYGYGWNITPDYHGHKLVSHGGSILVSTAHLAFIPDLKYGVAMAANSAGPQYSAIADGVFTLLMGKEPEEAAPAIRIKRKMRSLEGAYETYRGICRVEVVNKGGILHLVTETPFTDTSTPLIPEEDDQEGDRYYTLIDGLKAPIWFDVRSPTDIDLYVERYRYHKKG